ncbi:MAG TPA: hypothetical protein VNI57_01245, partial [Candidatus Saccharimonadales bacterium]|nr:hypothetical protein [Candidatus Saccharimonadales bacterium]
AAARGRLATVRLKLLQNALLDGREAPAMETVFVGETLRSALALEDAGIREAPTYPRGHLYRGHLRAAICALEALGKEGSVGCATAGIDDLRNALRLSPMSASMHAKVARYYIHAWSLFDAPARREALSVIERASRMNPTDKALQQALETARKEIRG